MNRKHLFKRVERLEGKQVPNAEEIEGMLITMAAMVLPDNVLYELADEKKPEGLQTNKYYETYRKRYEEIKIKYYQTKCKLITKDSRQLHQLLEGWGFETSNKINERRK